jgi:hypothetical protein
MSMIESTMFYTVLSIASTLVMLSIITQILQELYKFLTDSKSRAYMRALCEFIGPLALKLPSVDEGTNLLTSGPFQIKRFRTTGKFQPLAKEVLLSRMEQAAPPWIRRALKCLDHEAKMQNKFPAAPSPDWFDFNNELEEAVKCKGTEGYWNAYELKSWCEKWKSKEAKPKSNTPSGSNGPAMDSSETDKIDAAKMLVSFREKFLPHVNAAERNFDQLNTNFEYINRRRNLRLTFLLAMILVLLFDFSISTIFENAKRMSPQQAMALAQSATGLYKQLNGEEILTGSEESATANQTAEGVQSGKEEDPATSIAVGGQVGKKKEGAAVADLSGKVQEDKKEENTTAAGSAGHTQKDKEKVKDAIVFLGKVLGQLRQAKEIVDDSSKEADWGYQLVNLNDKIRKYKKEAQTDTEKTGKVTVEKDKFKIGFWEKLGYYLLYIFQCAITAVMICFGAPFWNDIAKTLFRQATSAGKQAQS